MSNSQPICVDLDGTLIYEDVTIKALKIYLKRNFFNFFKVIMWFARGRAFLKHKLAQQVVLDASHLKYNDRLLNFLMKKKECGRQIFLATACNKVYADRVADFLQIFDGVFASGEHVNLRAEAKAQALTMIFGEKGFAYAGNSKDDVKVWNKCAECILVNPSKAALRMMRYRKFQLLK